jgi:hypothetical protein
LHGVLFVALRANEIMSSQHLSDIRSALERSHWRVVDELPGNDYNISAVWKVARPDGTSVFHLEFEGLDDLNTFPIERAYGIKVREEPSVGAYLARPSRTWPEELEQFISSLERWAHNKPLKNDARKNARAS